MGQFGLETVRQMLLDNHGNTERIVGDVRFMDLHNAMIQRSSIRQYHDFLKVCHP